MDSNVILILLFVLGGIMTAKVLFSGGILYTVIGLGAWIVSMVMVATEFPLLIILYIALMVLIVIGFFKNSFKGEL